MSSGPSGFAPCGGSPDENPPGGSSVLQFLQKFEEKQNHRIDDLYKHMDIFETKLHEQPFDSWYPTH